MGAVIAQLIERRFEQSLNFFPSNAPLLIFQPFAEGAISLPLTYTALHTRHPPPPPLRNSERRTINLPLRYCFAPVPLLPPNPCPPIL
ncbi:hypothetical protein CDAR_307931 [Caerostris darwini]|uniref:Uncharacterized protein n=1 Tax=Caerostris darwini TaxID=1538125 RepID=A0AAV4P6R2_9ARAC|nr:hypothetical protein CDAR_307931 [Caerostris darwini]